MAKVKLHASPLTSAGVSVLAIHYRWGLPPVYSVKAILAATPGATFDLEAYRVAMGPPVSSNASYWQSDTLDTATAWGILTARLRQLGKLPANSFPDVPADLKAKAESNRKAILEILSGRSATTWGNATAMLSDAVEYDGPVMTPVWEAT